MANINPDELWFSTPDAPSLCRGGGNGENHPSQLYAVKKYVKKGMSFLDYGSGSGTTYEALKKAGWELNNVMDGLYYLGLDVIPKFTEYCKKTFPEGSFIVNPSLHKIDQEDNSWDVVYSRHVVDHMESFEKALDEHKRVAKKLVIVVLWVPLATSMEHEIKNIVDGPQDNRKTYENEYTNSYSHKKVMDYLVSDPEWKLMEVTTSVGSEVSGHDTVIVLKHEDN